LDVEAPEEANSLVASPTSLDLEAWLDVSAVPVGVRLRLVILPTTRFLLRLLIGPVDDGGSCLGLAVDNGSERIGLFLPGLLPARTLCQLLRPDRVEVDAEDASGATKFVVDGAKVDLADAQLAEQTGAHDAGLDGNVENGLGDDRARHAGVGVDLLAIGVEVAAPDVLGVVEGWVGT
jgi:hypothetical protein